MYVSAEAHLCYEWNHNKYMLVYRIEALCEKEKGMSFGKLLRSVPAALLSAVIFRHVSPTQSEANWIEKS